MELSVGQLAGVAHALMLSGRAGETRLALLVSALILLRFVSAASLPLSFDEAYYWLWSQHLAAGYFDHPPAIAFLIRAGTTLFGNTAFGVRVFAVALSAAASLAVWQAARIILNDRGLAWTACIFFNLTLMIAAETMAATPDAPAVAASAFFLWAIAKAQGSGNGRWWLAAGIAAGLALLSKYTGFFLGAGALAWCVFTAEGRRWLATPWPYLGAVLALALFAPVVWWNAQHDWASFRLQFGRVGDGAFTLRYLGEFLGGQLALASPFIFILGVFGLTQRNSGKPLLSLVIASVVPAMLYFLWQSLHSRVQGNWPSFLYPAFAIAAAHAAYETVRHPGVSNLLRFSRRAAVPTAFLLLIAVYVQVLFAPLSLGKNDPVARILAMGMQPAMDQIADIYRNTGARGVLTTNYALAGWLAFYLPHNIPVIAANEPQRWQDWPEASDTLLSGPLLYVTEERRDEKLRFESVYGEILKLATIPRCYNGNIADIYNIYGVSEHRQSLAAWTISAAR